MKKIIILLLFFIFILPVYSYSQDAVIYGVDCSMWKSLDKIDDGTAELVRIYFLRGFYDGVIIAQKMASSTTVMDEFPTSISYETIMGSIDEFCSDYRNSNIPLMIALRIINYEINGTSQDKIEEAIRLARSMAK